MAKFLKHVGKQGDRKVAIVWRQLPGDEHMCLVVYTELLNQNIHDPMMTCIESDVGQNQDNLADALNRAYTRDGNIILQVLHREGMLKKVQTSSIVMTPAPNSTIRLNELNDLLNEMNKGEEAVKRLAEIDSSRGLQDPKDVARRMREANKNQKDITQGQTQSDGILGNSDLANNLRAQATRMENEAKGLLAEAARLSKEAAQMEGIPTEKKSRAKKDQVPPAPPVAATKKPSRTKKVTIVG